MKKFCLKVYLKDENFDVFACISGKSCIFVIRI